MKTIELSEQDVLNKFSITVEKTDRKKFCLVKTYSTLNTLYVFETTNIFFSSRKKVKEFIEKIYITSDILDWQVGSLFKIKGDSTVWGVMEKTNIENQENHIKFVNIY